MGTTDASSARVGPYALSRQLEQADGRTVYIAREAPTGAADAATPTPAVLIVERAERDIGALEMVIAANLRHPRLFVPVRVLREQGKLYVVLGIPDEVDVAGLTPLTAAPTLSETESLKAAAGLADGLAFLHRSGVALHEITQSALFAHGGRAYLAVLETAGAIGDAEASDTNQLAQAFAAFLQRDGVTAPQAAATPLGEIVEQGARQEFHTADDLQRACAVAMQFALHNPLMGDDTISTARLIFHAASATSIGRLRTQNQDAAAITILDILDDVGRDTPVGIFIVADGMGGEARGELASRLGARIVTKEMLSYFVLPNMIARTHDVLDEAAGEAAASQYDLVQALANAATSANQYVRGLAAELGEATGSTLTAVAARGNQAVLAHLGDSRAYLLHGDTMMRLSEDHTLLARLEAMDHPMLRDPAFSVPRNFLYRSLGQEDGATADLYEFRLQPGDRLLLCSDGLWDEVDEQTIAQVLAMSRDPDSCAQALVRLANEGGGHDNSTAVIVFVEATPPDSASTMERITLEDLEYADGGDGESDGADGEAEEAAAPDHDAPDSEPQASAREQEQPGDAK